MAVAPETVCNQYSWAQAQNFDCFILQPFYRQQVEGVEAYVRLELERNQLLAALEHQSVSFPFL